MRRRSPPDSGAIGVSRPCGKRRSADAAEQPVEHGAERARRRPTRGRRGRRRAPRGSCAPASSSSPWPSSASPRPPARVTAPASGASAPAISRSSVDLPSPLRPTTPIRSPGRDAERDVAQHRAAAVALVDGLEVDEVARGAHANAATGTRSPVAADSTAAWHMARLCTLSWHSPAGGAAGAQGGDEVGERGLEPEEAVLRERLDERRRRDESLPGPGLDARACPRRPTSRCPARRPRATRPSTTSRSRRRPSCRRTRTARRRSSRTRRARPPGRRTSSTAGCRPRSRPRAGWCR